MQAIAQEYDDEPLVSHEGRVSIHFDGNFGEGVDSKNIIVREEDLFLPNPDTLILTSAQLRFLRLTLTQYQSAGHFLSRGSQ